MSGSHIGSRSMHVSDEYDTAGVGGEVPYETSTLNGYIYFFHLSVPLIYIDFKFTYSWCMYFDWHLCFHLIFKCRKCTTGPRPSRGSTMGGWDHMYHAARHYHSAWVFAGKLPLHSREISCITIDTHDFRGSRQSTEGLQVHRTIDFSLGHGMLDKKGRSDGSW